MRLMQVKLLAIDLDGTLLTSQREIHPKNVQAILRAKAQGLKIVLASGRIRPSMMPYANDLDCALPMICSNGAHVIGPSGDELHHFALDRVTKSQVLQYALRQGVHLNIYSRDQLFFVADSVWGQRYLERVRTIEPHYITPAEVANLQVTKMMLVAAPEEIAIHAKNLEHVVRFEESRMTLSEPEYLEFLSGKADKATGLRAIADVLMIERSNVAAIGDYLNDLEMLSWAGHSATVANADLAVKSVANAIFASNDDGGVADFVDSIVLNGRE